MTGIQARERLNSDLPMRPQKIERQELEYIRHGTQSLIASFSVAQGTVLAPLIQETRNEADFCQHIEQVIQTDPKAQWIFIMDQLNTHKSESLVQFVAQHGQLKQDLGIKGKQGILKAMVSREQFLKDPQHRIRIVYTPKHCSWLNQIEIWFSILVKKLLKRESFPSKQTLKDKIKHFIEYFNRTMARPFKWKYKGEMIKLYGSDNS